MKIRTATLLLATALAACGCSTTGAPVGDRPTEHLTVGVNAEGQPDEDVATLSFQVEPGAPEHHERLTVELETAIAQLDGVSSMRSETTHDSISIEVTVNDAHSREQVFADLHAIVQRFESETPEVVQ